MDNADGTGKGQGIGSPEQCFYIANDFTAVEFSLMDRYDTGAHAAVKFFLSAQHFQQNGRCLPISWVACDVAHGMYLLRFL